MPVKKKTQYRCNECGYISVKWLGRCPNCGMWDSMVLDEAVKKSKKGQGTDKVLHLRDIETDTFENIDFREQQFNRLFGQGLVRGSIVLVSGAPGSGKSTFAVSLMNALNGQNILYVSGEESASQLKMRFDRLNYSGDCDIAVSPDAEDIIDMLNENKYDILIIDSIQTINSVEKGVAGSPTMVKYILGELIKTCKKKNITVLIVGHITKDGSIAGPKTLEHMVDSVFIMDRMDNDMRLITSVKNRFGSTDEMILMFMDNKGLHVIDSIDSVSLTGKGGVGKSVTCTVKGSIPVAVEVQGLVTYSKYGVPQRIASGIKYKRFQMLLGIMDKYLSLNLGNRDVFVNVSGGLGIDDALCDLAFVNAVYSSYKDRNISGDTAFLGEVNLSGEIVWQNEGRARISHLRHLNIKKLIVPVSADIEAEGMDIIRIGKINELENI